MIFTDLVFWQILSISLTASGLFQIFGKFYHYRLNLAYWGYNPFLIKKHLIDQTIERVFILIVLLGFIIQIFIYSLPPQTLKRQFNFNDYLLIIFIMIIFSVIIVISFTFFAKFIAKKIWIPRLLEIQENILLSLEKNENKREENTKQLEDLFEINDSKNLSLNERITKLNDFYEKNKKKTNKKLVT